MATGTSPGIEMVLVLAKPWQLKRTLSIVQRKVVNSKLHQYCAGKLSVNGVPLFYEKAGCGSHPLLCFPGALGTTRTDFEPQLEHFGREGSPFTVVAFDPRGHGLSRPPERVYQTLPIHYLKQDAMDAHILMEKLAFPRYSVLGWSDGGVSGIHLAASQPESVRSLVVWGANPYVSRLDMELFSQTKDISNWSRSMRTSLEAIYGEQLQKLWACWVDSMREVYDRYVRTCNEEEGAGGGDLCVKEVGMVECPSLVLHGDKDPLVPAFHPAYLKSNLKNSEFYNFPLGRHNIHIRFAQEFNAIVESFLYTI